MSQICKYFLIYFTINYSKYFSYKVNVYRYFEIKFPAKLRLSLRDWIHFTWKSAQKLKVLIFLLLVSLCIFFLVSFRFPATVTEERFVVFHLLFLPLLCVQFSFSFAKGNGRTHFVRVDDSSGQWRMLTPWRAIQLQKWVIADRPSFPPWMWKESVTVKTVANSKIYIATRPLRNLSLESFKVSSLCYSTTIRKHRGSNKWQFYAQTNLWLFY